MNNTVPFSSIATSLQDEEKPIDIRRIIGLVRRYWYLLVFFPLLSVGLATLYTRYLVNEYKISSTILIKKDEGKQSPGNLHSSPEGEAVLLRNHIFIDSAHSQGETVEAQSS